jgi:hypothetical protein
MFERGKQNWSAVLSVFHTPEKGTVHSSIFILSAFLNPFHSLSVFFSPFIGVVPILRNLPGNAFSVCA